MAFERLSKLQKWILKECYKRTPQEMTRQQILADYNFWMLAKKQVRKYSVYIKYEETNKEYISKQAVLTNSLKNIMEKGLITATARNKYKMFPHKGTPVWYEEPEFYELRLDKCGKIKICGANKEKNDKKAQIYKIALTKKGIDRAKRL